MDYRTQSRLDSNFQGAERQFCHVRTMGIGGLPRLELAAQASWAAIWTLLGSEPSCKIDSSVLCGGPGCDALFLDAVFCELSWAGAFLMSPPE